MTLDEAKRVLMLFRPGVSDPADEEFAEAVELSRTNGELRAWFEQHCAFQAAMRDKFRQLGVPPDLKARLEQSQSQVGARRERWKRIAPWLAAAAAVALLALAGTLLLGPRIPNRFADYRHRMVRTAQSPYAMDIETNNLAELRRYLESRGAPSDYTLSPQLEKLPLTGGGLIRWRNNPVSMLCFDRGAKKMLFLFVMKKDATKDSALAVPEVVPVKSLQTVSWTQGGNTYLLAGTEEPGFATKYR